MKKIGSFLRSEAVACISLLLAALSMLIVAPDAAYAQYIDARTLVLLFCLMAVVGSAKEQGIFERVCRAMLRTAGDTRRAALVLVLLPFFSSMLVTNDVALLTFVPLSIAVLERCAPERTIFVVVMQTIAANLGSSLSAVGNPQNLYLSSFYHFSAGAFTAAVAPVALAGLVLCTALTFICVKPKAITLESFQSVGGDAPSKQRFALCAALFVLCVCAVLHLVDYRIVGVVVTTLLLCFDRRALRGVDVSLLLTFVFLFIFVGNMARIDIVRDTLQTWINGRALLLGALSSQVISNVPAALMLSSFTEDGVGLLRGVNIGGLGTPIASMASLISLRIYSHGRGTDPAHYMLTFSAYNFAFLVLLLAAATLCTAF